MYSIFVNSAKEKKKLKSESEGSQATISTTYIFCFSHPKISSSLGKWV